MQRVWSTDELGARWSLLPEDLALLAGWIDQGLPPQFEGASR
jgi:hypothetical protein